MTAVCETLGVARSNIAQRVKQRPSKARGRRPLADQELLEEIKSIIDDMPPTDTRHGTLAVRSSQFTIPIGNGRFPCTV